MFLFILGNVGFVYKAGNEALLFRYWDVSLNPAEILYDVVGISHLFREVFEIFVRKMFQRALSIKSGTSISIAKTQVKKQYFHKSMVTT